MLLSNLSLLATAPGGVACLRELILALAMQGKLVAQDPKDEPAIELLKKIRAEKNRLMAEGKIKRDKPLAVIEDNEKPYALPDGWEWARLGDLCSYIQRGKGPVYADQSEHRVISQKCVRWYGLDLGPARFITAESLIKYEAIRFLQVGDLLWNSTGTGTIGRACLVPPVQDKAQLVADSHVTVVRPVQLSGWFLWRWIQSPYVQSKIESSASGTTNQIELNTSTVINHLVPVPPLTEQSRIVTRVEELMRLCDALDAKGELETAQHAQLVSALLSTLTKSETPAQLADNWHRIATHFDLLLDRPEAVNALEQTILQLAVRGLLVPQDPHDEPATKLLARVQRTRVAKRKIVNPDDEALNTVPQVLPSGWTWASVDQISADSDTAITDGPFGANLKTEHYVAASGFRVVRLQNIGEGTFRKEHHAYIDQARFERLSRHRIFAGDIVVAGLVDESVRCCIVPSEIGPAIVKADCYRFSVHKSLCTEYICLYLSSKIAHEFASVHHHGLTLTRIGLGNFRSIPVLVPPVAEQSRIVTRVTQLRRLCTELRQRLTASQSTQAHLAEALIQKVA